MIKEAAFPTFLHFLLQRVDVVREKSVAFGQFADDELQSGVGFVALPHFALAVDQPLFQAGHLSAQPLFLLVVVVEWLFEVGGVKFGPEFAGFDVEAEDGGEDLRSRPTLGDVPAQV